MNPDILIPYRGDGEDELKYTLRSIERHFKPCRIVIVGDIPNWVQNAITMPTTAIKNKQLDCELNIREALPILSDEFYLWNDDFFLLKNIDDIENYHEGDISDIIKSKSKNIYTSKSSRYLKHSEAYLMGKGIEYPVAYTLHIPVKYNKHLYKQCSDLILPIFKERTLLPRTVYGNLFGSMSVIRKDVKIYGKNDNLNDDTFASTWEISWEGKAGTILRDMFNAKSQYEI